MAADDAARGLVLAHTVVAQPFLTPELKLHLITHQTGLWTAAEDTLAREGLPMPYWAFAWPGGQALARYLLDAPHLVRGKRVLDFGAGGAVEGVAAAKCGALVDCTDLDPLACAAASLNAALNGVTVRARCEDVIGQLGPWDTVLMGDVCYEPELAARLLKWIAQLTAHGVEVLVGDPGRVLPRSRFEVLAEYDAPHDGDVRGTTLWKTWVARGR